MAEAAVESSVTQTNRPYFCHQCTKEIQPTLPDYTCPTCHDGFIEELGQQSNTSSNVDDHPYSSQSSEESNSAIGTDPALQFVQLWENVLLADQPLRSMRSDTTTSSSSSSSRRALNTQQSSNSSTEENLTQDENRTMQHSSSENPNEPDNDLEDEDNDTQGRLSSLLAASSQQRRRRSFENSMTPLGEILQQVLGNAVLQTFQTPLNLLTLSSNPGDYAWGPGGLDNIITQLLNQFEGTGPPPCRKDDINNIPTVTISNIDVENGLECSVCKEDLKSGDTARKLPCTHLYHEACILPWLEMHNTCPVCRKSVVES